MSLAQRIILVSGVALLCWGAGWWLPVFAFPAGQAFLLLLWGLAPWWVVVPAIGIGSLLLHETFGPLAWPMIATLWLCTIVAIPLGEWLRSGKGPIRSLTAMPALILGPWVIWLLLLDYTALPKAHLTWWPPGLVSMLLIWCATIVAREAPGARHAYRLRETIPRWRAPG